MKLLHPDKIREAMVFVKDGDDEFVFLQGMAEFFLNEGCVVTKEIEGGKVMTIYIVMPEDMKP